MPLCKNKLLPVNCDWLLQRFPDQSWKIDEKNNHILAYYGLYGHYQNVNKVITNNFLKNDVILIPKNCPFNTYFGDPAPYQVKQLTLHVNDKEYVILENNPGDDVKIQLNAQ